MSVFRVTTGDIHTPTKYVERGYTAVERRDYVDGMSILVLVTANQYTTLLLGWNRAKGTQWWSTESSISSSACTPQAVGGFYRTARRSMLNKMAEAS